MAEANKTMPITITCGEYEIGSGEVDVPINVKIAPADDGPLPVSAEMNLPGFRRNLVAFLREAADAIEAECIDEPAVSA